MFNTNFLIIALFGFSGATALTYEVLWNKYLSLLLGNSVSATATTLAVFMGGMAIGSYIGGRLSEQVKRNVSLYGAIEGIIGIYCMFIPTILHLFKPLLALTYNNGASPLGFGLVRFMVLAVVLLFPASLMGMTFPILGSYLSKGNRESGSLIGFLYGFNCLGAVAGALAASFLLIPIFGQTQTAILAAIVNLAICGGAITIDSIQRGKLKNTESKLTTQKLQSALKRVTKTLSVKNNRKERSIAIVCAGGGMASMLYQIGWTRTFTLLFGSSVYTFSLIIAIFIGGLALGSFLISIALPKIKNHLKAMAVLEAGTGIAGLAATAVLTAAPEVCTSSYMFFNSSFIWATLFKTALIATICLLPTVLMGTIIPLAAAYFTKKSGEPGQAIGKIYSANTVGCIVGALAAGFIISPILGLKNTLIIAASINILLGLFLLNGTFEEEAKRTGKEMSPLRRASIPVMTLTTVIVTVFIPSWDQSMLTNGSYLYSAIYNSIAEEQGLELSKAVESFGQIVFNQSGPNGIITVRKMSNDQLILQINGKPDASTGKDMGTQLLLGHLPALLAPKADKMLVVGLGSGATLGALQMHNPKMPVDCIEISHEIVEASKLFTKYTNHSLAKEDANIIEDDGRTYLSLTDKSYNLIVSEPSNPWISGMTNLFTREYFELCKSRLEDNGLMCQWVQGYNMSKVDFASILKSFQTVFPETTIWKTDGEHDYIILGHKCKIPMDSLIISDRLKNAQVAQSLRQVGIESPEDLLNHYIGGPLTVASVGEKGTLITDDNMLLEYSAPQSLFRGSGRKIIAATLAKASRPAEIESILTGTMIAKLTNSKTETMSLPELMNDAKSKLENGELLQSLSSLYKALEVSPEKSLIRQTIGQLLTTLGHQSVATRNYETAANYFEESLDMDPSQSSVHNSLGNCLIKTGDNETAKYHFAMAINYDPLCISARNNLDKLSGMKNAG